MKKKPKRVNFEQDQEQSNDPPVNGGSQGRQRHDSNVEKAKQSKTLTGIWKAEEIWNVTNLTEKTKTCNEVDSEDEGMHIDVK